MLARPGEKIRCIVNISGDMSIFESSKIFQKVTQVTPMHLEKETSCYEMNKMS